MSWSSLPDDVTELILTSLPLVGLACVSTTCGAFQALYRRKLALEHEDRCNLAVNYFGRNKISSVTSLIIQLLKGEALDPSLYDSWSRNGFWQREPTYDPRALSILVCPRRPLRGETIYVVVNEGLSTWKGLVVDIPWDRKGVHIYDCPREDDEDVKILGLVQAILRGGLAQFKNDAGKWATIQIAQEWWALAEFDRRFRLGVLSRAGLKAQIGPLMHFASRCICLESRYEDRGLSRGMYLRYCLHIGEVEPAGDEATV